MFFPDLVHDDGGNKKNKIGDHFSHKGPQQKLPHQFRHKVHEKRPNCQHIQDLRRTEFNEQIPQVLEISGETIAQIMLSMVLQAFFYITVGDDAVKTDGCHGGSHKGRQYIVPGCPVNNPCGTQGQYGAQNIGQ